VIDPGGVSGELAEKVAGKVGKNRRTARPLRVDQRLEALE
jgi:hypothetical protein